MAFSTEDSPTGRNEPAVDPGKTGFSATTFARNSLSNVIRTGALGLVAILLPTFLTHRLPTRVYGAWVLVLQLGAYVGYLNLGVQTALAKFIAEYETRQDHDGCGRCASVALRIMLFACLLGICLTILLATRVPVLFHDMPAALLPDVRLSVLLVGISLSIGLASSVFSGIFLGLQRYQIPVLIAVISRLLYAVAVCTAVSLHRGLVTMAIATAAINLLTSFAEIIVWRKLARDVKVSLMTIDSSMVREMLAYCSILTIWSACMLVISGLDITIVGHYAFTQVAYYSIANSPTNMVLMVFGALMGPLLPAASALSVTSTPKHMGHILLRSTRYSTLLLLTTGLPMLVAGYLILRVWVGIDYANHSVLFLDILLLANILRNLCAPYATVVVATSQQRVATVAALTEAVVNLTASILLARQIGAVGVAFGTLIGSIAGVAAHFGVSMHYTRTNFDIGRAELFLGGILRPAMMALPSLALATFWWGVQPTRNAPLPNGIALWTGWFTTTTALAWFASFTVEDRVVVRALCRRGLDFASGFRVRIDENA